MTHLTFLFVFPLDNAKTYFLDWETSHFIAAVTALHWLCATPWPGDDDNQPHFQPSFYSIHQIPCIIQQCDKFKFIYLSMCLHVGFLLRSPYTQSSAQITAAIFYAFYDYIFLWMRETQLNYLQFVGFFICISAKVIKLSFIHFKLCDRNWQQ